MLPFDPSISADTFLPGDSLGSFFGVIRPTDNGGHAQLANNGLTSRSDINALIALLVAIFADSVMETVYLLKQ
ncbi:MAG TPA: hypothetical protein VGI59_06905 [Candidatus Udaeobacter sp.]|jgi:hypothetical protein